MMRNIKRMTGEERSIGRLQFARELSVLLGYPINDCLVIMSAYEDMITELVKKGISVRFSNFGVFSPRYVEQRDYHNISHQGEYVTKPAHNSIKFKPSNALVDALNEE